jgi:two-component system, OmpR family, response regulator
VSQFCTSFAAGLLPRASSLALLLHQVTVLVVEDDLDSLELFSVYLQLEGANVVLARSIANALETAGTIDVLVSELLLSDGDGVELLRRLRGQTGRESLPAVALTSLSDPDWQRRALQAGFNRCVLKPFPLAELTRCLAALTRN